MTQGENESLEDFEERFQLAHKRAHNCTMDEDSLKHVFFRGVREYLMETFNLLANGGIYQLDYAIIKEIFKNHYGASTKKGRFGGNMVSLFSSSFVLTNNEIGGMLEDMKTKILHSLALYLDKLQVKKKREGEKGCIPRMKGSMQSACFINQNRPITPKPYQQNMGYNPS